MNAATKQMKIFIAVTDELLYEYPENIDTPLIPYSSNMQCHHWLDVEINPEETQEYIVRQFAA